MDAPVKDAQSRPKNADGTADWETIFEDAENGLIPLVARAQSMEGLTACATLVINQLFTRKNDAAERDRLQGLLARLLKQGEAEGGIDGAREGVIGMLRSIKQERLLKAAAYVAEKRAKPESIAERERRKAGGAFLGDVHHLFASKTSMFAVVGVLVLAVLALVGVGLYLNGDMSVPVATQSPAATTAATATPPAPSPPVEPRAEAQAKSQAKSQAKAQAKPQANPQPKPKPTPKPNPNPDPKPNPKHKPQSTPKPET